MTKKWADYVITAVRFNTAGTHIEAVQRRADNGDSAGTPTEAKRSTIVSSIEAGTSYCTATKGSDGNLQKGAEVKIVKIDGEKFLKTKTDGVKKDNLDKLPTF